jgi:Flp pilus assembly protein CpaB
MSAPLDARRRRLRAVLFAAAALLAAGAAARVPLRPVVVAADQLAAGEVLGPDAVADSLVTRTVPARFVPPGSLGTPTQALGLQPVAPIPAGAYVLGPQLEPPSRDGPSRPGLSGGRRPVEIAVAGARALLAAGPPVAGAPVDVLVTTEPEGTGPGRTYVAAARVPLLALQAGQAGGGAATLGLTRPEALELISAENFARGVRLLPAAGSP